MLNLHDLVDLLLGGREPNHPDFPDVKEVKDDMVYFDSLTRGLGISGNPGTGKTTTTAHMIMTYARTYPTRPVVVFDASGSLTNEILLTMEGLPPEERARIRSRVVLDMPGHPNWVVPKPMFHSDYGLTKEELVQKAVGILKELNHEKMERNPTMATAISTTAPELFRLIFEITDDVGESWQITEAKKLLIDTYEGGLLEKAIEEYGKKAPSAKWYLEAELLKNLSQPARESRIGSLITALEVIETDPLRAKYGYPRPGVSYNEIIEKGLIYIISGEKLANQDEAQAWTFWDEFASLRAVINQRIPHNPKDKPVLLVIDEVYKLFEIKGMAKSLGQISTYFRSRKLMPVIILQAFWQLEDTLMKQYWNLGNLITFQMDNLDDAYKLAQQMFKYETTRVKFDAPKEGTNPTAEGDRGQYLQEANWIQNLGKRRMLMRRYVNEQEKEGCIAYVHETTFVERAELDVFQMVELKEQLLKNGRAVHVKDALRIVNNRNLDDPKDKLGISK
jgi:hypothetical protein